MPLITPQQVMNILTLRYDKTLNPIIPLLSWRNFKSSEQILSTKGIEFLLKKEIYKKLDPKTKSVSIALSSGMDSALVATILKKHFPDITLYAFHVVFANSVDESDLAIEIANHLDIDIRIIRIENYLSEMPAMIMATKKPFWDLHWYYIAKEASNCTKYIITGNGGDELFGGYLFRYKKFLTLINNDSTPRQKVKAYLNCHQRDWVPDQKNIFGSKCPFDWNVVLTHLLPYFNNPLASISQVFLADYRGKLCHNFLPLESRISSHFDLQSFSPFLSSELIYKTASLPPELKCTLQNSQGKILLMDILARHNMSHLVATTKLGFSVNTLNLWKSHAKELCKHYLLDSRVVKDDWINKEWINKHIHKKNLNVRQVNKFLGLLALEVWYRLLVTHEIKSDEQL